MGPLQIHRLHRPRIDAVKRVVRAALVGAALAVVSAAPALAQNTYKWNKTSGADWTSSGNWLPTRTSPANTDILVFDGAVTPNPVVNKVPTQTIGRLRFINNVNATLASGGSVTLTISSTTIPALDLQAGSTVTVAGSGGRPIVMNLGNNGQATIAGSLVFTNNAHQLLSSTAGNIQFTSTGSFTAGTSFSGSPFGTSGTANVVVFQSRSTYTHTAGNTPFGLTAPASRVVFSPGSRQFWRTTAGFQTSGRTFANLTVQNNIALSAAGTGNFQVDSLTVESGSSFTHTGSGTGSAIVQGDISSAGTGGISITPGSGGIQLNGGRLQTIGGAGTGTVTFGGNATVASGTTLALSRTLTFSTGAMTVNGTFQFNQGGAIAGGGNFVYGVGGTLVFAQTSGSYAVNSTSTFWPSAGGPPNITVGASGITMNAGATRTVSGTLATSGPVANANLLTFSGTLRLNAGGSVSAAPSYTATGTLAYGAAATVGIEWGAGTSPGVGIPNHVTIVSGAGTVSLPNSNRTVPGNLTITSGTLAANAAGGDLRVGGNWSDAGSFTPNGRAVTFVGPATQTLTCTGGETFATLALSKTGGSVQLLSAVACTPAGATNALEFNGTTDVLDLNGQSLSLAGPLGGTDASGSIKGSTTSNLTLAGSGGLGTLRMATGAQNLGNLTLNASGASGGVTLGTPVTVSGALTLTAGLLTPGSNTLTIAASGSASRTAGWINGGLTRGVPTGSPTLRFDIGTATDYLPVTTAFASVSVAGTLVATTTAGEHPNIATSGLDATHSVNRYFTLAGSGVTFTSYAPTFTFLPGDVDAGTLTDSLEARRFSGGSWIVSPLGARTATTTQATGVTGFGDFAVAEPKVLTITASAGPNGTITPSGAVSVRNGRTATFAITPNTGYHVQDVLVDGGSVGAVTSYSFVGVVANHTISATFAINIYTLTTQVNGLGSVSRDLAGPSYTYHTLVTLTATPLVGNGFTGWTQDLVSAANPVQVFVDSNMTVTANFQRLPLNYVRSSFTAAYQSISTGTGAQRLLTAADDSTLTIPLPFNFTFSGIPFTTSNFLAVNANGFAYFSRTSVATSSPSLANNNSLFLAGPPGEVLAPWYDDLAVGAVGTNPAGSVLYQTQGVAGFRTMTVQWTNVSSSNLTTGGQPRRINFQLLLYEASQIIEFRYGTAAGSTYSNLESGSIGLKDSLGGPGSYINGATGSKFTSTGMMTTNKWPTRFLRFTPGTPAALAGGTYTVGLGQNYVNLTDAVADLNQRGVAGPVTFQLTDAVYDSAAANGGNLFPLLIGPVAGVSATNTITIQSASNATLGYRGTEAGTCGNQTLSNAITTSNEPILGLVGADYVTLKRLSFAGGNLVDRGVLLLPSSTADGAQHNTLHTVSVTLNRSNPSSIGIQQSVPSTPSDASGTNSDNRYLNLQIQNVYAGMSLAGNANLFDGNILVSAADGGQTVIGGPATGDIGNGTPSTFALRASNQRDIAIQWILVRNVLGTSTGTVDGIVLDNPAASGVSSGICNISNNQVTNLDNSSTGAGRVSGIRVNLTSNPASVARVYNNFVTNFNSSSTTTASRRLVGIMVQDVAGGTGATQNVDFNSVRLEPASVACSNACFEIGTTTGPVINVRNNVFGNFTGTQTGSAKHYAWVSPTAGALGAPGSVSDYNVLFIGNGVNGFVGYAAADKALMADWRGVAANDAHSSAADPQYTSATNLHLRTDLPTPAAQAGSYFGGALNWVTADIDGQVRDGVNPDLGADEGVFQVLTTTDMSATSFVDPADGGTKNAGSAFSPQATFANAGTTSLTNIPVRYRIRGPLPDTTTLVYDKGVKIDAMAPGASQTVTFPTVTVAAGGVYRIEALSQLSGDLNTANDRKTGTVDIVAPLSGTYSIGTGQPAPFNTLTNAVARLNLAGATGPVVFQLVSPSYGVGETFPININAYPGGGATNSLTLRPAPGVTASITGASTRALFVLNGADYVTIDGSMTPGGTTRDLTLTNTSSSAASAVVWGQTTTLGDPVTHTTVRNVIVSGSGMNATLIGIGFGGSTIAVNSNGNGNAANWVQNCDVRRVQYGIYSSGQSATVRNTGTVIRRNVLESAGSDAIGVGGIFARFEDGIEIDHNRIGNLSNGPNASMFAISLGLEVVATDTWLGSDVTNANVHHNVIHGVTQTNAQGLAAAGIAVAEAASGTTTIANNVIAGVLSPAYDPDVTVGILVGGGAATTHVYFNSVSMTGNRFTAAAPSFCLAIGGADPPVDVRDNVFYTSQFSNGVGDSYLIGLNSQLIYTNLNCDYNDLFSPAGALFVVGGLINTPDGDQHGLAAWQTTTGKDAHSISVDPSFLDPASNLHITTGSAVANIAQPIAGIVDDVDDEPGLRTTTPDLGADEFTAYSLTLSAVGSGTVSKVPDLPSYPTSTVVQVVAAALANYHFVGWSGDLTGRANPASVTMVANTSITGTFALDSFTVAATTSGHGTAARVPSLPEYEYGTPVTFTATPDLGYHFTSWTGDTITAQNPYSIVVTRTRAVNAEFVINTYVVTTGASGGGSITRIPDQPTYDYGTPLRLVATPASTGYKFSGWTGDTTATSDTLDLVVTRERTINATFPPNLHTLAVAAGPNGSVSKSPDLSIYDHGALVTVTATPSPAYHFVGWSGDTTATTNPMAFRLVRNMSLTGTFAINTYALSLGTLGDGTVAAAPSLAEYPHGTAVTLTATPSAGQSFLGWTGDTTGTTTPLTLTMTGPRNIVALFTATVTVTVVGNGTVTRQPDQSAYPLGSAVLLTAIPGTGWHFVDWSGDTAATTNPFSLPITTTRNVTATFAINTYTLTLTTVGNGTAAPSPLQATYTHGTPIQLSATPAPGNAFVRWSGDTTSTAPVIPLLMTSDRSVTATFTYLLSLTTTGPGSVTKTPDQPNYVPGTIVHFSTTPQAFCHFVGWSGDTISASPTLDLAMSANRALTATFALDAYPLAVSVAGSGSVARAPDLAAYDHGTTVTLTALPDPNFHFTGWSGDTTSSDNPLVFTMTRARSLIAGFAIDQHTLTVTAGPNGAVAKSPDESTYDHATSVTVAATPDVGYHFERWEGDTISTDNPLTFNLVTDRALTATFALNQYPLTNEAIGSGDVSRDPDLPVYPHGASVTLTATPAVGWHFMTWTGDVNTAQNPIGLVMSRPLTADAVFEINLYPVTLIVDGGHGRIIPWPELPQYPHGTILELIAEPDPECSFVAWGGDAAGTDPYVLFSVEGPRTVTATFAINSYPVDVSIVGAGAVTKIPDLPAYPAGTIVQLVAAVPDTSHHVRWGGSATGTNPTTTVTSAPNVFVIARFDANLYNVSTTIQGGGTLARSPNQTQAYYGSTMSLTATPQAGFQFAGWQGALQTLTNPVAFPVDSNMAITAQFVAAPPPTLATSVSGSGSVTRNPDQASYAPGTNVTLSAVPGPGWLFSSWTGDVVSAGNPVSVFMDRDKSVQATFRPDGLLLNATVVGPGTITRVPDLPVYAVGSVVHLQATTGPGAHFASWTGDTLWRPDTLTVVLAHDVTIQARFGYRLALRDTSAGSIQATPRDTVYVAGSKVSLLPKPAPGAFFAGWQGDAGGLAVPLVVTMDRDKLIGAVYVNSTFELRAEVAGHGAAFLEPNLDAYDYGDHVAVTAVPDSGYHFTGWTQDFRAHSTPSNPDDCPVCLNPQGSPLDVRVVRDLGIVAHFERDTFRVSVVFLGGGTVSRRWEPVDGPDTTIVLGASPRQGWAFAGWTGGVQGTENPVRVNVSGPLDVVATFVRADGADSSHADSRALPPAVTALALAPVSPNPAVGRARFDFALPAAMAVSLEVYDVQGRQVARILDGALSAGRHQAAWSGIGRDGSSPAGVFFVRLSTPQGVLTRRFALTR